MSHTNEILQNLSNYPDALTHPVETAGILGGTAVAIVAGRLWHRKAGEKTAEAFGGNRELAEKAVVSVRGNKETPASRRRRLAPGIGFVAGAGIALASFFGHPTFSNSHSNKSAEIVVVNDSSLSMLKTADLGGNVTRYSATQAGLKQAGAKYAGNLAVVSFGSNVEVSVPLEPKSSWQSDLGGLKHPDVNPNGGDLSGAVSTALSLLPESPSHNGRQQQRDGRIIILSDGTVDSSAQEMADVASSIKKSGASVKVVVPGQTQASYRVDGGQPIASGSETQTFAAFGAANVEQATTVNGVVSDVEQAIAGASTVQEQDEWWVPLGVGLALAAGSAAVMAAREVKRS